MHELIHTASVGFSDHVRRRFVERYRLAVSADDLRRMAECIRRGEAVLLKGRDDERRAVYATPRPSRKGRRGKLAPVVYDRRFGAIVTVLPEEVLWTNRGVIRQFRERRVAELGAEAWPLKFPAAGSGACRRADVRLALAADALCFHVHCETSACPFPVSLYVRDAGRDGHRMRRREIVYLKANGFTAGSFGAAAALLRQQFKQCLALRTGVAPPNTAELAEAFIDKLMRATRCENLAWSAPAPAAAAAHGVAA